MPVLPPSSPRTRLALLRLCLSFIALCLLLSQLEVAQRAWYSQRVGAPHPLWAALGADEPRLSPHQPPFMGVSIDPTELIGSEQVAVFQELKSLGFGWVRVRVAWDQVEPAPRVFDWDAIDHTLDELEAAGLVPLLLLDGSPAWARAPNDRNNPVGHLAPPANPAAFARFARSVAARYGARVRYYQIWNEPNIAPHWGARHVEGVNYARMLKAAVTAIRAVDADTYIVLAALAPTNDRGHLAQDESYFLNRIYATGAAPYFDAVAIQPFGFANPPSDPVVDRSHLNFRRALLVRQTMLDAGDGATPIWMMRYGWNRAPASPWRSVSPEAQMEFTRDALEMAYRQWPWVVAMGWPVAVVVPDDPSAGFALTPELAETFRDAATTILAGRRPLQSAAPALTLWWPVGLTLLAVSVVVWRGVAAARLLPWRIYQTFWNARPAWQQGMLWAALLTLYYLATWPPLLLLYGVIAALGFLAQPRIGLTLALFLLPLYDYHKEFTWLSRHWYIPPTQAVLICLLPALVRYWPAYIARDRWQLYALGWLATMLLGAAGAWYWPAYWVGMINLVFAPLLLYWLIRAWATTSVHAHTLTVALAAGGVLVAGIGMVSWLRGQGTVADGMLRLTGLGYSSNHTALYLIRTVAITIGLMLAAGGKLRWLWGAWTALTGVALLLTGSRGAMVLGVPAGAIFLLRRQNLPRPSPRLMLILWVVVGVGLAVLLWMWQDRLMNIGTMIARTDGWIVALYLWLDNWLFGVGPDGFWWTFPAHLWLASDADPNLRHPHIIWLELATSGGLLAIAWLLAGAWLLYRWAQARGSRLSWVQVGLLTGLIASFAHAQVDAFQALSELAGWNWAALALLLALDEHEKDKNERGQ